MSPCRRLTLISSLVLFTCADCVKWNRVRRSSAESEMNLNQNYEILQKLKATDAGVELRGLGKCLDRLYIFLSVPYAYFGQNDMSFDNQTNRIRLADLNANYLRDYFGNQPLMQAVCRNNLFCEHLDDDIYMSIYTFNQNCLMFVVDTSEDASQQFKHSLPLFDLHNNLQFVKHLAYSGLIGIPYSSCGQHMPIVRFLYYGQLTDHNCQAKQSNSVLASYSGESAHEKMTACSLEMDRQKKLFDKKRLLATMDDSKIDPVLFHSLREGMAQGKYKYGACIDGRNIILTHDDHVLHKSSVDLANQFNYFGYRYALFSGNRDKQALSKFLNVEINMLSKDLKEMNDLEQNFGTQIIPISAYYDSVFTDIPPSVSPWPWSGMPSRIRRVYVSDNHTPSKRKFFKKYIFFIVVGAVFLILLFCLFLFCLTNIRCFPKGGHRRDKGKQEMIVVHVENPPPAPEPEKPKKKKKKEPVPKLMPLPPPTMRPVITPVSPAPPLDNPSPQSLVIPSKRATGSDPCRTYESPTANTFSTIYKKGRS